MPPLGIVLGLHPGADVPHIVFATASQLCVKRTSGIRFDSGGAPKNERFTSFILSIEHAGSSLGERKQLDFVCGPNSRFPSGILLDRVTTKII